MGHSTNNDDVRTRFQLKAVLETSKMLVESRESDFVQNNLLLVVMGKLMVTKAAILLTEPGSSAYHIKTLKGGVKFNKGDQIEFPSNPELEEHSYFYGKDVKGSLPALISNMDESLFFNLRTSDHHLGYLFLGPKADKTPFSKDELEFVEGLCIISTVALSNSKLFNELKSTNRNLDRRIHELNTLFDLSKEFNLLVDREKISRIFKFALLGQLFIRKFFLIFKNQDSISLLASNGLKTEPDQSQIEELFNEVESDVLEVDETCRDKNTFIRENEIAALIGMTIQNEKVAVIGVGQRANKVPFKEADFNFLRSLANLAVISIQKTYFLEDRIDKERMEEELSIAKSIQQGLLPDPIPKIKGVDLAARNISSREVGGDYFDVAETPDGNSILAIADVTGKGVPAALLMANLQSMLHVLLPVDIELFEATGRINNLIHRNTPPDKFITFFWAKYVSTHKIFRFVNAGHNPPLILRAGESEFDELSDGGLLLGAMETMAPYKQTDIQLNPDDLIVCYTDGVNEAMNPARDEEYDVERLKKCILNNRDKTSEEILEAIVKDVLSYSGNKLDDDLTLLVFKADADD